MSASATWPPPPPTDEPRPPTDTPRPPTDTPRPPKPKPLPRSRRAGERAPAAADSDYRARPGPAQAPRNRRQRDPALLFSLRGRALRRASAGLPRDSDGDSDRGRRICSESRPCCRARRADSERAWRQAGRGVDTIFRTQAARTLFKFARPSSALTRLVTSHESTLNQPVGVTEGEPRAGSESPVTGS